MNILYIWDADYPWDVRVEKICEALNNNGHEVHIASRNLKKLPVNQRRLDKEVDLPISGSSARLEAERCLSCGRAFEMYQTCWSCLPCEIECPVDALEVRMPYLIR